jgi:hypothetical protein
MQHPVVSAAEAIVGEHLVRIGGEIPVGEKEELDEGKVDPILVGYRRSYRQFWHAFPVRHGFPIAAQKYVSTIDIFLLGW